MALRYWSRKCRSTRFGAAEDHVAELKDLGVDQFKIYLMHDAQEATLDAYGEEIIPNSNTKTGT